MFCPNCGSEHEGSPAFCCNCGAQLNKEPLPAMDNTLSIPEPPRREARPKPFPDYVSPAYAQESVPLNIPARAPVDRDLIEPAPDAPARKGRHWPALLIMAVLTALGLLLFFLMPYGSTEPAAPKSCFTVSDGLLTFHEEYYTGGSSLTVPERINGQFVTGLAKNCFYDCDSLIEIILPDSLTYIGDYAFAGCESLRGILIPDRVSYIGKAAFEGCGQLEAVCVPASVVRMGPGVFSGCSDLRHVFYSGKFAAWQALCSEYINGNVTVYAADGTYPHWE